MRVSDLCSLIFSLFFSPPPLSGKMGERGRKGDRRRFWYLSLLFPYVLVYGTRTRLVFLSFGFGTTQVSMTGAVVFLGVG